MDRTMAGKVVVVTGASAGIGRATVRRFAQAGASVGLIARGRDGLEAARREVELLGGRALVLSLDVADAGAVDQAAERVDIPADAIFFAATHRRRDAWVGWPVVKAIMAENCPRATPCSGG